MEAAEKSMTPGEDPVRLGKDKLLVSLDMSLSRLWPSKAKECSLWSCPLEIFFRDLKLENHNRRFPLVEVVGIGVYE